MLSLLLKNSNIIEVPIELVNQFLINPLNSLRDYVSKPTNAITPFFTDVEKLDIACHEGNHNPFDSLTRTFDDDFHCDDNFFRYMHVDLAYAKDGVGISMCHIPEFLTVKRTQEDKEKEIYEEIEVLQPKFVFDFVGRIKKIDEKELIISSAMKLIFELATERGFYIHLITFDRFESIQSIYTLRDNGFNVSHLSIDRTSHKVVVNYEKENYVEKVSTDKQYNAAFENARYAIAEERIIIPYHEDWEQETRGLEYIAEKDKVVKSPHTSDDLIQSIVGSAFNASNNESPEGKVEEDAEEIQDKKYENELYQRDRGVEESFNPITRTEDNYPSYGIGIN